MYLDASIFLLETEGEEKEADSNRDQSISDVEKWEAMPPELEVKEVDDIAIDEKVQNVSDSTRQNKNKRQEWWIFSEKNHVEKERYDNRNAHSNQNIIKISKEPPCRSLIKGEANEEIDAKKMEDRYPLSTRVAQDNRTQIMENVMLASKVKC